MSDEIGNGGGGEGDGGGGRARAGRRRMAKMTPEERTALARKAAIERWRRARAAPGVPGQDAKTVAVSPEVMSSIPSNLPVAKWPGELEVGIACYVLDDERRIISRTGATEFLTEGKGGGNLESYTRIQVLQKYVPPDLPGQMVEFLLPGVVNKAVKGMEAETFLEICRAYVDAWTAGDLQTESQIAIAKRSAVLLAACAKVGLIALIDEATGYQRERPIDALQFKLKLFLAEEMRKWEKTFPDELWEQFGRLTGWKGTLHSRPKYWGKLVMELIYQYLDPDVAEWLREHAPEPNHGQNYHQWMSQQYGLKKLIEHIWKVVGIASACDSMAELRAKMRELYGPEEGLQYRLKLVKPGETF